MSIVLARIDSRLIHGQVLEAWVPHTRADCIVVANDEVAASPLRRAILEGCVPRGIRVVVGSVAEIAQRFGSSELDRSRVLLLFESSRDALRAYREGVRFAELNLGNMHPAAGKVPCNCTICLDAQDVETLGILASGGVQIVSQCIPQDGQVGWERLVRSWKEDGRG